MDKRVHEVLALGRPSHETNRLRKVVALSVECADELGDSVLDSRHLLAGIFREGASVAYHVLNKLDVTQAQIDNALVSGEHATADAFQIDDDIRTLLDAACAAADEMSHRHIGTEHLLIGAAVDGTKSGRVLAGIGLSPSDVTNEVFAILGHRLVERPITDEQSDEPEPPTDS